MNKKFFIKNKDVFDYWLNGGGVWFKRIGDKDDIWELIEDSFEEWHKNYMYVEDDNYAEFRKALKDGKTIQFLRTHIGAYPLNPVMWLDWNSHGECFDENTKYRIKSDLKYPAYFKELSSGIVVKFEKEEPNTSPSSKLGIVVEGNNTRQKTKGFTWRCWDTFTYPERWEYLPNYVEVKFKVGETITITSNSDTWEDEIVKITATHYHFKSGGHLTFDRQDAQLKAYKKPKYKVGDWVRNLRTHKAFTVITVCGETELFIKARTLQIHVDNSCNHTIRDLELWYPRLGDVVICNDQPTPRILEVNFNNCSFVKGEFRKGRVIPYIGQPLEEMK